MPHRSLAIAREGKDTERLGGGGTLTSKLSGPCVSVNPLASIARTCAETFAVAVGGFSVMDHDLYVLVRLDPDVAGSWSDEDVVRRWGRFRRHIARCQCNVK
jgi:hypothetical protein